MTVISLGDNWTILATLNVAGDADTEITTTVPCKSFAFVERTGLLTLQYRRTNNATDYWPVFSGTPFSANITLGKRGSTLAPTRTYSLGFLRRDDGSTATTPVVVLVTY